MARIGSNEPSTKILSHDHHHRLTQSFFPSDYQVLFTISILVITFLPASNIFFKTGFVVAERVLYLPSIGFILMIGLGLRKMSSERTTFSRMIKHASKLMILWIIVFFAVRTFIRCQDWWVMLLEEAIKNTFSNVFFFVPKIGKTKFPSFRRDSKWILKMSSYWITWEDWLSSQRNWSHAVNPRTSTFRSITSREA